MFEALGRRDIAVINADDRFAPLWHGLAREAGSIVTFGMRERADVSATDVRTRLTSTGFATVFDLVTPQGNRRIELALAGEHNVMNALAAAAAAMAAGASIDAVQRGLQSMRGVAGPSRGEAGAAGRAPDRRRLQRQPRFDAGRAARAGRHARRALARAR